MAFICCRCAQAIIWGQEMGEKQLNEHGESRIEYYHVHCPEDTQ